MMMRRALLLALLFAAGCPAPSPADASRDAADATTEDTADVIPFDTASDSGPVTHACMRLRPPRDAGVVDASPEDGGSPRACNGSPLLCDRRYDEVAYPTAHNAMSNSDEHFYLPNQHHGLSRALEDGVRGFMIDTHYCDGEPSLAHSECWLGHKPLSVGLCEITQFLDTHPNEVVSLQIEPYITDADTVTAFEESGLVDYVRYQPHDAPFPTLGQMIDDDRRLMVFIESGGGDPNWLMPLFDYSFDTPYTFATAADFNCDVNRGSTANPLFTINHWLQNPGSDPQWAQIANANPLFIDRVRQCQMERGRFPNFIAVDFYDIGELFSVVRAVNGI
jgi:hypothetical protein